MQKTTPFSSLAEFQDTSRTISSCSHNRPQRERCVLEEKTEVNTTHVKQNQRVTQSYTLYTPIIALQVVKRADEHLLLVTQRDICTGKSWMRADGRHRLTSCRREICSTSTACDDAPASNNITAHYLVQQVHYPRNPLQPGPIYF